ncbi:unnamed protein product [Ophioblennius macclurei]
MLLFHPCLLSSSLLTASLLAGATLSDDFKGCGHFFYMQTPPAGITGAELRRICQRYAGQTRYATLYDGRRRIPLYSAYVFHKSDGRRRMDTPWMYEPQLVSLAEGGDMRPLPLADGVASPIEASQAVLEDYVDAVEFRRCSLNPDLHHADPGDKSSTYTLTNVVPMTSESRDRSWTPYLDAIRRRLNNFCHGPAFVVTGVTVSGVAIRRDGRDRLSVPKHLWLAYCCSRFDRNAPYDVRFMFPGYGGYASNEASGDGVAEVPLEMLEKFLKGQEGIGGGGDDVGIFHRGCVSENTFKKRRDAANSLQ